MPRVSPVEQKIADVLADPETRFVVTRRVGRGRYDRRNAASMRDAEALGTGDRRSLIYAVDRTGQDWPIKVI